MFDTLLSLIAPHHCLGCEREGYLLCPGCRKALPSLPSVCYRCGTATLASITCKPCRGKTALAAVYTATKYEGVAKDIVWKLKFGGTQAAVKDMAKLMLDNYLISEISEEVLLVPIPTATSHVRTRGYDQARLLARSIARSTGHPYTPCLARVGQRHQIGATRKQRFEQLADAIRITAGYNVSGAHILLIDDVLTTGATLEAAASVFKKAGARQIDAIVFARA